MKTYRSRVIDSELDELAELPALAIEGPKGTGKTETARRRAVTLVRLDEPEQQEIAAADPKRVLVGDGPVLLDEWQRVPSLWDTVRRAVDDGVPPGPFLLTGSAAPGDDSDGPQRHSGAARIDIVRMRPMTLIERVDMSPTVSLRDLFDESETMIAGEATFCLEDYTEEITRSGFPGIRVYEGRALRARLDGYVSRIIDRDFEDELGKTVRRPEALRRWMAAYAAATATTTTLEKIRDAATSGQGTPAKTTVLSYRDALTRLFILDPVEGWTPSNSHLKRLTQTPKHHLTDPALAVSLLGLTKEKLLKGRGGTELIPRDGVFLGDLFESLVTQAVRVFAQSIEARVFHMRTRNGEHEIDLIVEDASGEVVAFEVKLSGTVDNRDCRHLNWLHSQIGDRLKERVVVTTGSRAYRRPDGICVVPFALLGP
ncbi:MAG: ATP-binding protein [Solirubrobacterales bacterium]|nr:ATP-binding protein [Solirubrobacterales bacterium]